MLSQTGGTCECSLLDKHKCDTIPEFAACKEGADLLALLSGLGLD